MLKVNMETESNDLIVSLLTVIVNILHIVAGIALVIVNYGAYDKYKEIIEIEQLAAYQFIFSLAALVVYVILVGTISLLISINRNLQRLVSIQKQSIV
jgi:hypothetical protein